MTNNTLAIRTPINEQLAQAEWFAKSGFMPKHLDSAAKIYAVVTLGQELGLGPWAAINNIYVIGGKPSINANLMLSLIQSSGLLTGFDVDVNEQRAIVTMARGNVGTYTSSFSMDDAKRAELTTGYNAQTWKKYPKAMLKARAVSDCARTLFADVLLGLYSPEELGARVDVNADGEITVAPEPTPMHEPAPLMALTGAEAKRLAAKWINDNGLTAANLKEALGGSSSSWTAGYEAADARIAEWVEERETADAEPDPIAAADDHLEAAYEEAMASDAS